MQSFTPLRYPGGKAKLYNFTKKLIIDNFDNPPIYAESFVGGAGLALKLLSNGVVSKIYINDFDYAIYCFWHSLKYENSKFKEKLKNSKFTIDEWDVQKKIYLSSKLKSKSKFTKLEIGYATFYLNRTNRSGILTAGPIGGRLQNGNYLMDCRFNIDGLLKIVENFNRIKENVHVYHRDAYKFIHAMDKMHEDLVIYLDPPYVVKGPGLYKNSFDKEKHEELKESVKMLSCKWFMTYDKNELIQKLYKEFPLQSFDLNYSAHSNKKGKELAIFSQSMVVNSLIERI